MSSAAANDLKKGDIIIFESEPFKVLDNRFHKPGKGRPVSRLKLKSISNSQNREITTSPDQIFNFADIEELDCEYLYSQDQFNYFMDKESFEMEIVSDDTLSDEKKWMHDNLLCSLIKYKNKIISVKLPTFIAMKVSSTENVCRGDTVVNKVMKKAILENGTTLMVPSFIKENQMIKIDTRIAEYKSKS